MKKIRFRGKNKALNEWYYGDLIDNKYIFDKNDSYIYYRESSSEIDGYLNKVDTETIGEYIRINDDTNTLIYEGDIVEIEYDNTKVKGVIEYHAPSFFISTDSDLWEIDDYLGIKVLGNIHDNPELIEVEG